MGINAGASAITGVYLGDQMLTKGGGGSATENIQAAIDAPDVAELVHYIQGPDTIAASSMAMQAIAASSTAMNAVLASSTAMNAVLASSTAMQAIAASSTAMQAIAASSTAMQAIAASSTAMQAIAASSTAMQAIAASSTAMNALYDHKERCYGSSSGISGKLIILEISSLNSFSIGRYGYATLSNGSSPNWSNYTSKFAYFRQFKTYCTYIQSDTDNNDWIDYYEIK